jgi:7-cyano-7-deazaguanine synthase in queuosine biosynthesis
MNQSNQTQKRPLVLFSGGMDSTYLIQWYLENGMDVDTLYVHASQNPDKCIKEMDARIKLFQLFTELYNTRQDWVVIDGVTQSGKNARLTDVIKDYEHNLDEQFVLAVDYSAVQPVSWLMAALIKFNHKEHSELAIGYLLGDQMPAFREEMLAAWSNLWVLLHGRNKEIPPLRFPLLDGALTKYDVLKRINKHLAAWTWVCERPATRTDDDTLSVSQSIFACGRCNPCRLQAHTIADIDEDDYSIEDGKGWLHWVEQARDGNAIDAGVFFKKMTIEEIEETISRIEGPAVNDGLVADILKEGERIEGPDIVAADAD